MYHVCLQWDAIGIPEGDEIDLHPLSILAQRADHEVSKTVWRELACIDDLVGIFP